MACHNNESRFARSSAGFSDSFPNILEVLHRRHWQMFSDESKNIPYRPVICYSGGCPGWDCGGSPANAHVEVRAMEEGWNAQEHFDDCDAARFPVFRIGRQGASP